MEDRSLLLEGTHKYGLENNRTNLCQPCLALPHLCKSIVFHCRQSLVEAEGAETKRLAYRHISQHLSTVKLQHRSYEDSGLSGGHSTKSSTSISQGLWREKTFATGSNCTVVWPEWCRGWQEGPCYHEIVILHTALRQIGQSKPQQPLGLLYECLL